MVRTLYRTDSLMLNPKENTLGYNSSAPVGVVVMSHRKKIDIFRAICLEISKKVPKISS